MGRLVVIDKGEGFATIENFVPPNGTTTGVLFFAVEDMWSYMDIIENHESHLLAINHPHTDYTTPRIFVSPKRSGSAPYIPNEHGYIGWAWPEIIAQNYAELTNHAVVPEISLDAYDGGWSAVFGHELAHIALNYQFHYPETWSLLYEVASGDVETPAYTKRLEGRDQRIRDESGPNAAPVILRGDL
ncbi:MAG: hypothetical protein GY722_03465 [bacterium]|nr:hypothetical protein [bacterium]